MSLNLGGALTTLTQRIQEMERCANSGYSPSVAWISTSCFLEASYVAWSITTRPPFFKKPNPCEEKIVWGTEALDKWMKESPDVVLYTNGILRSHKKNRITPFVATWMNLEIIILNGAGQTKTNIIWCLHVESTICHKWTCLWNRNRLIARG